MSAPWSFFVSSLARPGSGPEGERALVQALAARVPERLFDRIGGELVVLERGVIAPATPADVERVLACFESLGKPRAIDGYVGAAPPAHCDPFVDSGILVPGLGDRTPPPIETPWRELHEHDLGDLDAAMRALEEELDEAGADEDADRFDLEAIDVLLRGARIARELRIVLVG